MVKFKNLKRIKDINIYLITDFGIVLKPFNSECGKVILGWRTRSLIRIFIILFLLFLIIILEIYNFSVILDGINVSWTIIF